MTSANVARAHRAAGLILLGLGALALVGAISALITASSRQPEAGEAELVALGRIGAAIFVIVGSLLLVAAAGVLRGNAWGRRLGLAMSGGLGALGVLTAVSSPMPWDHSANLGAYQQGPVEWLVSLLPFAASWVAFVALLTRPSVPTAPPAS